MKKQEPVADAFDEPQDIVLRPENQLELTDKELDEEITKQLTANNPNAPTNIARYSVKEQCFKFEPMVDQLVVHYATDGFLLHNESDEATRQIALAELEEKTMNEWMASIDPPKKKKTEEKGEEGEGADGDGDGDAEDNGDAEEDVDTNKEPEQMGDDSKQLRNQFNFADRASQTVNNPMRDRSSETEPPATCDFSGSATQWGMYDAYMEDQERLAIQKEMQKKQKQAAKDAMQGGGSDDSKKEHDLNMGKKKPELMSSKPMTKAVRVMERMVNQNSYDDIAQDFKYWEDQSDQFRVGEGTLLPLWKFYNEKAKRRHVTAICWNPEYHDLFAVGYGSFDFVKQMSGLICCYSLKNPSHPEYAFTTDSGVMCLDFHPQHSSLLCVGLYDGSVLVYDVRNKVNRPIRQCDVKTGKHTDPVWQVKWAPVDLSEKDLKFYSVSSDGRVTRWTMSKSELVYQDVMELKLVADPEGNGESTGESNVNANSNDNGEETVEDTSDAALGALAGGCCVDFNKEHDHLFVVGTEEGRVHKCSTAYNSQYLETYNGHHMAVYTTKWNTQYPKVFISASADWTVKLWDHGSSKPAMSFDLHSAVGDVAWSPTSATTFAAVTSDGKVHVYDLHENKHEPMCEQKIVRKAKLTKIAFNPVHPVLLVGDDRGCVTSLKLSPNLRKGNNDPTRLEALVEVALKGEE
tara:strand:+ start:997 stop:3066 length:2070 start_codon:yes stop_codon:yes gene_type:complete